MATPPFRIGSLLVSRQVINRAQLRRALRLQRTQPHRRIGELLLELRYLSAATLRRVLGWQKRLRWIGMLVALLGVPMDAVLAAPFDRIDWRSACEAGLCSQTPPAAPTKLVIDLGRAIDTLKGLLQSPYGRGETAPVEAYRRREGRLRFNLNLSTEQPALELLYRF